jgi:hypothetical protein
MSLSNKRRKTEYQYFVDRYNSCGKINNFIEDDLKWVDVMNLYKSSPDEITKQREWDILIKSGKDKIQYKIEEFLKNIKGEYILISFHDNVETLGMGMKTRGVYDNYLDAVMIYEKLCNIYRDTHLAIKIDKNNSDETKTIIKTELFDLKIII